MTNKTIERVVEQKYFYDTEFIENGKTIDLISIGIVCEDGREYYAISKEFDGSKASDWVKENVLAKLETEDSLYKFRQEIKHDILEFVGEDKPEFWGYYADYDHVALCQLFGTMMDLPEGLPMYTRDIKQLCDSVGNPELPKQGKGEHNALDDARWNMKAHDFLTHALQTALTCGKPVEDGKAVCGVAKDCHLHDWRQREEIRIALQEQWEDTLTRILERLEGERKKIEIEIPDTLHRNTGFNSALTLAIQIIKEELTTNSRENIYERKQI